jgi:hypothetical protein
MKTGKIFWTILLSAFLVLSIIFVFSYQKNTSTTTTTKPVKEPQTVTETGKEGTTPNKPPKPQSEPEPKPEPKPKPEPQPQEPPQLLWGVDTASPIDQAFLQCVVENYGKPTVFGRYLETKEGVSAGLTPEEVELLHQQGIKIIPIYNHFTNATTYETGAQEAQAAIAFAQQIGIPEGKAIFADIEPTYPVDEAFIRGWVDTLLGSPYKPGIYGVFTNDSSLTAAYQAAISSNQNVHSQTIIWRSNPDPGVTPQANAPEFQPGAPENVPVSIWQYGIDGETCNIDTNLIQSTVLDFLW